MSRRYLNLLGALCAVCISSLLSGALEGGDPLGLPIVHSAEKAQKTDAQKSDSQKPAPQNTDGQKTPAQKVDAQKTAGQKADAQNAEGQKIATPKTSG